MRFLFVLDLCLKTVSFTRFQWSRLYPFWCWSLQQTPFQSMLSLSYHTSQLLHILLYIFEGYYFSLKKALSHKPKATVWTHVGESQISTWKAIWKRQMRVSSSTGNNRMMNSIATVAFILWSLIQKYTNRSVCVRKPHTDFLFMCIEQIVIQVMIFLLR